MADEFRVDADVSEVIDAMDRMEDNARDTGPLMKTLADILLEGVHDNFANEEGPDGPWVPLDPDTVIARQKKGYTGKKLQRSRMLHNSIQAVSDKESASAASNLEYAPIQFLGGTPDMPPGPADVPARNAMHINDETSKEIDAEIDDWFEPE